MADVHAAPGPAANPFNEAERGRTLAIVVYGLYLAAFLNGITAIIGVVIAYVGRSEARGTIYESHYTNAIHTFWVTFVATVILCAITFSTVVGMLGGTAAVFGHHTSHDIVLNPLAFVAFPVIAFGFIGMTIWYLYRTIMGLVRALDSKPY